RAARRSEPRAAPARSARAPRRGRPAKLRRARARPRSGRRLRRTRPTCGARRRRPARSCPGTRGRCARGRRAASARRGRRTCRPAQREPEANGNHQGGRRACGAPFYSFAMRGVGWLLAGLAVAAAAASADPPQSADWPYTEGGPGGGRYSPLTDITWENVASLRVACTHPPGVAGRSWPPPAVNRSSAFESPPIVVDGRLIFTTPRNRVIALDPETGRELWKFDPNLEGGGIYANMWISRGVAYWRDPHANGACAARVFLATLDARLFALDASTARP